jgi:hypothetical protein
MSETGTNRQPDAPREGGGRLLKWTKRVLLARIIHKRLRKLLKERAISIVPDVPRPDARGPS